MINERDFNINYSRTKSEDCFCFFEPMVDVSVGQSGKTMLIMNAKGIFSPVLYIDGSERSGPVLSVLNVNGKSCMTGSD